MPMNPCDIRYPLGQRESSPRASLVERDVVVGSSVRVDRAFHSSSSTLSSPPIFEYERSAKTNAMSRCCCAMFQGCRTVNPVASGRMRNARTNGCHQHRAAKAKTEG